MRFFCGRHEDQADDACQNLGIRFAIDKKILFLPTELWTNLRLIATTEKNAKAIALSFRDFNQSIFNIVKPECCQCVFHHCAGFANFK